MSRAASYIARRAEWEQRVSRDPCPQVMVHGLRIPILLPRRLIPQTEVQNFKVVRMPG